MLVYIYFIQATHGGPIKIGKTWNVPVRLASLQTASPYPLKVLKAIRETPQLTEGDLHTRFKDFRMSGEWFRDVPPLLFYIAGLQECDYSVPIQATAKGRRGDTHPLEELHKVNLEKAELIKAAVRSVCIDWETANNLCLTDEFKESWTTRDIFHQCCTRVLSRYIQGYLDVDWRYADSFLDWFVNKKDYFEERLSHVLGHRIKAATNRNERLYWNDSWAYEPGTGLMEFYDAIERLRPSLKKESRVDQALLEVPSFLNLDD